MKIVNKIKSAARYRYNPGYLFVGISLVATLSGICVLDWGGLIVLAKSLYHPVSSIRHAILETNLNNRLHDDEHEQDLFDLGLDEFDVDYSQESPDSNYSDLPPDRCIITATGRISLNGNYIGEDLGQRGNERAIADVAQLVRDSGDLIRNVDEIDVNLVDGSSSDVQAIENGDPYHVTGTTVEYHVAFRPGPDLFQRLHSMSDSELKELIGQKMKIADDTASGRIWVEAP